MKRSSFILAVIASIAIISMAVTTWVQAEKIDINIATVQELTQLNKIGPKTAELIVKYREINGLFKKPEDIMNVKGIGASIWELNKDRITVGESADTATTVQSAASDLVSKAASSQVSEKAGKLTNELTGQLSGGAVKSVSGGQLETRVTELENKITNLEKKISELEKKIK